MRVYANVRNEAAAREDLRRLGKDARPALVSSINRVGRDLSSRVVRKSTEV